MIHALIYLAASAAYFFCSVLGFHKAADDLEDFLEIMKDEK